MVEMRLHGTRGRLSPRTGSTTTTQTSELAALAKSINDLAGRVRRVQVIFNNNYEDQGQRNASTLVRLLRGA